MTLLLKSHEFWLKAVQSNPELKKLLIPRLTDYIPHQPTPKQSAFLLLNCAEAFYGGAAGGGKILSNDGVVLTPFGWKKGSDLCVGDVLNNPDGSMQRIVQIKPEVTLERWRVCFSDGTHTDVAADHLWLSWRGGKGRKIKNKRLFGSASAEVIETREMLEWIKSGYVPQIPVCEPQPFNMVTREIDKLDPYLLGVLLGDGSIAGTQSNICITCHEDDKNHYRNIFGDDEINYKSQNRISFLKNKNKYIKSKLKLYGLFGTYSHTKFIPTQYKLGSIEARMFVIQGLMDTDGWSAKDKNACYFDTTSKTLAEDVAFILRSLGCVVKITSHTGKYKNADGVNVICKDVYSLYIRTKNPDLLFRMKRKQYGIFGKNLVQKSVSKIEIGDSITGRCITVSNPNGLYITNDFIVTHNSDALLMAALQYVDVPGYNALLVRDTYANLIKPEGLITRAFEWLYHTDARWNGESKTWKFPSGATLSFGYLDGPHDHFNFQGAAYQFVGIDEAVAIRENQAMYLFSRIRKLEGVEVPLRFRCTANPPTREQVERGQWVKDRYVNPKTRKSDIVFIPAWLDDNPYLDAYTYRQSLSKLDPITRKQLEEGDWNVQAKGTMFDRTWFKMIDTIPKIVRYIRYWDLAATEAAPGKDPDWTTSCKMGVSEFGQYYITSIIRVQRSSQYVEQLVRQTADTDGRDVEIYMEQEPGSSGKTVISHYRRNILQEFVFDGDVKSGQGNSKISRAMPFASQAEAGNVFVLRGLWNDELFNELELFPAGKHDDQVDCCSGAFDKLAIDFNEVGVRWL